MVMYPGKSGYHVINSITGSLGSPNIKVLNLHFSGKNVGLSKHVGTRSWRRQSLQYTGLVTSRQADRLLASSNDPASEIKVIKRSEEGSEEIKSSDLTSPLIPNFNEVEFLVTKLCDSSSIGELELKLAGFHLHIVRDLTQKHKTLPPPIPASVSANNVIETPKTNGSVSTTSLAISKPVNPVDPISSPGSIQKFLDRAADEGLVIIPSPKVGFFRRSRTIKGKRSPPSCKEKQRVEEGQVICYIEQLGGQVPIESDVSGEVIKILRKDGDPVGYGDALVAILPSFPGIKKLQ
ncbi:acetyl-CoA carboxylase biotin carboxyl carrier protein [Vigna unguiculata]|uniref:Acetyl-CoA carboxylase biotin carboxyl carrier protein n=1 Tax=Vigna unguiculata TaxID=3917 RepID=A0A4D6N6K1_VIGUN|nr:acetyl-CoA carboxylase biotin carboxyl carrier protein [Vigna unguiculata]